jgi:hypothetical protein
LRQRRPQRTAQAIQRRPSSCSIGITRTASARYDRARQPLIAS